jgi:hypothetical protein
MTGNAMGEASGDRFVSVENLIGSAHRDWLSGNALANVIWGLGGDDTLAGRAGNDTLLGGTGADRFVFQRGDDTDRIRDFQDNVDTILLGGFAGVTSASTALGHARQSGRMWSLTSVQVMCWWSRTSRWRRCATISRSSDPLIGVLPSCMVARFGPKRGASSHRGIT